MWVVHNPNDLLVHQPAQQLGNALASARDRFRLPVRTSVQRCPKGLVHPNGLEHLRDPGPGVPASPDLVHLVQALAPSNW